MSWFGNDEGCLGRFVKGTLIGLICIPLGITIVRYSAWKMAAFLLFWILCPGVFVDKYIWKQDYEDFLMTVFFWLFYGNGINLC